MSYGFVKLLRVEAGSVGVTRPSIHGVQQVGRERPACEGLCTFVEKLDR